MTQISGKKYQIKNAAGTENRFPYTVMEAVLGLNTYLQDQFSALADIYMPIEGITESKTGQEFVYRQSAATIKAKSLTLDRIYGKTLAWNQLVASPNGENSSDYTTYNCTLAYNATNKESTITISGTPNYMWIRPKKDGHNSDYDDFIAGHRYLFQVYAKAENAIGEIVFGQLNSNLSPRPKYFIAKNATTSYQRFTVITPATILSDSYGYVRLGSNTPASTTGNITYKKFQIADLTLLYSSEIDGMTDAQILAKFESDYPGYHDFGNKLISNDASALETVGFNLWDEEWESGAFNGNTGEEVANGGWSRSKKFIPVLPSTDYFALISGIDSTYYAYVFYYDANYNFIANSGMFGTSSVQTTPPGSAFMRIQYKRTIETVKAYSCCYNLSDPAKNGTYEPYRKSTLQLGLNNFKVKSHNIWDEEWEMEQARVKTKNYISVVPGSSYYLRVGSLSSSAQFTAYLYDDEKNFVSTIYPYVTNVITIPSGVYFIKMLFPQAYGTTYHNDICINVSSSFNGQYEPHGNIAITDGLKSAGSVSDEIVGNKYIKRIGKVDLGSLTWGLSSSASNVFYTTDNIGRKIKSGKQYFSGNGILQKYALAIADESGWEDHIDELYDSDKSFCLYNGDNNRQYVHIHDSAYSDAATLKTAMSGVMLYYELATPIEYELVEPLIYSMAAGTTEARISPNADGLSAPFCCDMTYDANANNDSANAQYAATAGRLYNTHKLWGRDFDGSNDVSGALSGVTTIDASGNITTAAQLISTVATGTAPLSVASTTEVANLHSYTATKLHTQRTLWGQNFDGSGNVTGDMSSVGNIAFSASGKNIASLLYFDTTNSRVGVGASSPAYKLDVNGTLNASGNATLGGTLDARGNTTIGGTFTVGTSSVNKATTLYGALTASGAVSFSDTLTIAGLTTFNGNAILPANKTFTIGPSSGTHATLEWDATNSCVKITGNLRVTGWIEQQGTQS